MALRGTAFHPRHPQPRPESPGTRLYVTPEADVDLACRCALKRFLQSKILNPSTSIESVSDPLSVWRALRQVNVLDPACGEGHFLVGMSRVLTEARLAAGHQILTHGEAGVGVAERDMGIRNEVELIKADVLANNLYGVEVDRNRVDRATTLLQRHGSAMGGYPTSQHGSGDTLKGYPTSRLEDGDASTLKGYPTSPVHLVRGDAFSLATGTPVWPEVLENGGFDIVIGNPPFVRHEQIHDPLGKEVPALYKGNLEQAVYHRFPKFFGWDEQRGIALRPLDRRSDLAALFTLLGLSLTRPGGILAFVLPTALFQARYGLQLREALEQEAVVTLWERPEERSFKAGVNTVILFAARRQVSTVRERNPLNWTRTQPLAKGLPVCFAPQRLLEKMTTVATLGMLGKLRYSVKTGINEFFYPDRETIERFAIDRQYLKPVLRSPRTVQRISVNDKDLGSFLFHCLDSADVLKDQDSTGALAYISWGARQRTARGIKWPSVPSVRSRKVWYSVALPQPAHIISPRFFDRRFFFLRPTSELVEDQTFYGLVLAERDRWLQDILAAILNSSVVYLFLETRGRTGLGEGVRQYALCDFSSVPVPDPRALTRGVAQEVVDSFERMCARRILPVEQEMGQEDRHRLDGLVGRAFGLTERDLESARRALRDLTSRRLHRARTILERELGEPIAFSP